MVTNQKIFKPSIELELAELKSKFEQAPYPDSGVAYAGYFKRQLSGNRYELKPQTPYYRNFSGSLGDGILTSSPTFITAIAISAIALTGKSSTGDELALNNANNSSSNTRFSIHMVDGSYNYIYSFPTPLQFENGIYYDAFGGSGTGRTQVQLWGWTE
jgi:hypothetical protein